MFATFPSTFPPVLPHTGNTQNFPDLFTDVYHFNTGVGGLTYTGLGLGFISAAVFGARISDKIYNHVWIRFSLVTLTKIILRWRQRMEERGSPKCVFRRSYLVLSSSL
jgi:hypothetical protein